VREVTRRLGMVKGKSKVHVEGKGGKCLSKKDRKKINRAWSNAMKKKVYVEGKNPLKSGLTKKQ